MEGAQPYAVIYQYLPIRLNFLKEVEPWRPPLFGRNFGFGMAVRIGGLRSYRITVASDLMSRGFIAPHWLIFPIYSGIECLKHRPCALRVENPGDMIRCLTGSPLS